jgi:hypothetical protein
MCGIIAMKWLTLSMYNDSKIKFKKCEKKGVCHNKGRHQKSRKTSNKQPNILTQDTRKTTTKQPRLKDSLLIFGD